MCHHGAICHFCLGHGYCACNRTIILTVSTLSLGKAMMLNEAVGY